MICTDSQWKYGGCRVSPVCRDRMNMNEPSAPGCCGFFSNLGIFINESTSHCLSSYLLFLELVAPFNVLDAAGFGAFRPYVSFRECNEYEKFVAYEPQIS